MGIVLFHKSVFYARLHTGGKQEPGFFRLGAYRRSKILGVLKPHSFGIGITPEPVETCPSPAAVIIPNSEDVARGY